MRRTIEPRHLALLLCLLAPLGTGGCDSTSDGDGGVTDDGGGSADAGPPPLETCGNGMLDDGEACDADLLDGETCSSLMQGGGVLACDSTCRSFDTTSCDPSCTPDCGGLECGPDPVCGSDCGACEGYLSCGGGGAASQCGAMCDAGCPAGFTCDGLGVCGGGDVGGLVLDVAAVTVTATVTVNGGPFVPASNCVNYSSDAGRLTFRNVATDASVTRTLACDGSAVTPELSPGRYEVTVGSGFGSTLPDIDSVVGEFDFNSSTMQVFDVAAVTITGTATVNGGAFVPASNCVNYSSDAGRLTFRNVATDASVTRTLACDGSAVTPELSPGRYEVTVGSGFGSTLPDIDSVVGEYDFNSSTMQVFDVGAVTITGTATVNGGAFVPASNCVNYSSDAGRLTFRNVATDASVTRTLACDGSAVTPELSPGRYEVTVGSGFGSTLPDIDSVVGEFDFNSSTMQVFDVGAVTITGTATVNGGAFVPASNCVNYSSDAGRLTFRNVATDASVTRTLACDGSAVTPELSPGRYEVTVGSGFGSTLPDIDSVVGEFDFNSSTAQVFDVGAVTITGTATVNGGAFVPASNCVNYSSDAGRLTFRNVATDASVTRTLACDGSAVTPELSPGRYEVTVGSGFGSTLPDIDSVVGEFDFNSSTAQVFDVAAVTVMATVTVNGAPFVPAGNCVNYSSDAGRVYFRNIDTDAEVARTLPCDGSAITAELSVGVYEVRIGSGFGSTVPDVDSIVVTRLGAR